MAFFLPFLPEASAIMLPRGSPALCEHASLLLLELSLKTFKGTLYPGQTWLWKS